MFTQSIQVTEGPPARRQTFFISMGGINMKADSSCGRIHHPVVIEGNIEPICQKLRIPGTFWQNIPKQIHFFEGVSMEPCTLSPYTLSCELSASVRHIKLADIIYWCSREEDILKSH